jgi:hypothetical protein
LNGGAFSSQRHSASYGNDAPKEFDRQDAFPFEFAKTVKNSFQMRDATTTGFGCKMSCQRHRDPCAERTEQDWEDPASQQHALGPGK